MDPSIFAFVAGSCVSFLVFYWVFSRRLVPARTRKQAEGAQRFGAKKLNFLDDLRHEAGLRAQAVLEDAVHQVNRGSRQAASAVIDARLMERLRETRSMLQSLLPREFTCEFDHIVRLLHAPAAVRRAELNSALERLERRIAEMAGDPKPRPASQPVGLARSFARMTSMRAAGDAA